MKTKASLQEFWRTTQDMKLSKEETIFEYSVYAAILGSMLVQLRVLM